MNFYWLSDKANLEQAAVEVAIKMLNIYKV